MGCFGAFGRLGGIPISCTGRLLLSSDAFDIVLPSEGVPCGFLMLCLRGTVGGTDADYAGNFGVRGGAGTAYSAPLVLQVFTCIFFILFIKK